MVERNYCPYCGEKLTGAKVFCGKCGKKIPQVGDNPDTNLESNIVKPRPLTGKNIILIASVIIISLVVSFGIGYYGYTHTDERLIIGTWILLDENGDKSENSLTFYENGTVLSNGMAGDYMMSDGEIYMSYSDGWSTEDARFEYKFEGNRMILTMKDSGNQAEFIKQ